MNVKKLWALDYLFFGAFGRYRLQERSWTYFESRGPWVIVGAAGPAGLDPTTLSKEKQAKV